MATKTVDVDEMMNTVLVCDICMEPFDSGARVPLLLPCRHSFCVSCLESLSKGGDFHCPTCRHLVTVSGPVALSLPKDIISLKVVDYLAMKSAAHMVPCTDCVDKNTASYRCLTCHLYMCEACQNGHRRLPFCRNHNVRTLGELAEAPAEFLTEAETCGEHVGMTLNLYCDSEACKVALCTSCAMVAHRQDSHSIMDLSKGHERAKKVHKELLGLLEKEEEKQRGISDDVQKKMELVETSAAEATDQANQVMDRLQEAVEKRRQLILEKVREVRDRQRADLRKIQEETSSHVSQIQEATGYLRRAERLSRQAEFISVVHAQGPSVRKLANLPTASMPGNISDEKCTIKFKARTEQKTVEVVLDAGSVTDLWTVPNKSKKTLEHEFEQTTPADAQQLKKSQRQELASHSACQFGTTEKSTSQPSNEGVIKQPAEKKGVAYGKPVSKTASSAVNTSDRSDLAGRAPFGQRVDWWTQHDQSSSGSEVVRSSRHDSSGQVNVPVVYPPGSMNQTGKNVPNHSSFRSAGNSLPNHGAFVQQDWIVGNYHVVSTNQAHNQPARRSASQKKNFPPS